MMLLAAMSWAAALVALALIGGATLVLVSLFSGPKHPPALPAARLDELEDELLAIRTDLAEIKATLAEIDRMFKSVG